MSATDVGPEPPAPAEAPDETIVRKPRRSGRQALYAVLAVVIGIAIIVVGAGADGLINLHLNPSSSGGSCSQVISGAGSTLVAPLMFQWAYSYSGATVDYDSIGSGAGIAQITSRTVDFGASDAPMTPAQRAAVPSPGVITFPESIGAAVPIYNLPGISQPLRFDGSLLAAIYLGDITNWNNSALQALNPGVVLPHATIVPVYRSDGSGTTFIWTSFLSAENATWRSTIGYATAVAFPVGVGSKGNAGVSQTVKSTVDSIGYVDINYALTDSIPYGSVENPTGNFVLANLTNIASAVLDSNVTLPAPGGDWYNVSVENAPGAHDYPISSLTYLFVYKDLGQAYGSSYCLAHAETLINFLEWIVSEKGGQTQAAPLYYVPLPPQISSFDETAIASITYNGAAIPSSSS